MRITTRLVLVGLVAVAAAVPVYGFGRGAAVVGVKAGPKGVTTGHAAHSVSTGPLGGVHAGTSKGVSHTGPGGVTVQHGTQTGVSRGPLGGVSAGSTSGTRVTGPGGKSYTHTQGAGAKVGPAGGVKVGGSSSTSVRGPLGGGASVGHAGGVAVGPMGGVRAGSTSTAAVRGPLGGGTAVRTGTGVAVGPGGGVRVGHSTSYVNRTAMRTSAVTVRSGFHSTCFSPTWYTVHKTAWVAPRWTVGYTPWRPVVWAPVSTFLAIPSPPIVYDYGTSVVIMHDEVYVNGIKVYSAPEYAEQATAIVETGRSAKPAENDEWQPLGVFGLLQGEETTAQRIFQLAVNKDGVVRGNYYDAVADNTLPVVGSVDKKTQRVAWSIGQKKDIVFETGLNNFTEEETGVLVHYGKDSTQQMVLVRLEEPKGEKK